jgi:hypothetical protein
MLQPTVAMDMVIAPWKCKVLDMHARASPERAPGCYRVNFLYLIRCGMTVSMPRRRILSFS